MQGNINKHANDCSEIIASLMSERCNRELISKAGLEKHIKRCKGDERPAIIPKSKQKKIVPIMDQSVDSLRRKRCLFSNKEQHTSHSGKDPRRKPE